MIRKFALALATIAAMGAALPALAQEENPEDLVSDAVDQALWCGGLYAAITQIEAVPADQKATAEEKGAAAFTQAKLAMDADGIEESEYDRLIQYYTEIAVEELTTDGAEMRYTAEECDALIAQ